jgi:hypothetical protein
MGLFSRKKVAKRLDVSVSRITQMTSAGEIVPPIENDDDDRGWPESYVEELAARRGGRQTSRSIYGIPAATAPFTRISDVIVEGGLFPRRYFVQLLSVGGEQVALMTQLRGVERCEPPLADQLGQNDVGYSVYGDGLIPVIHLAAREFEVDLHHVVWIYFNPIEATEIVVTSEASRGSGHGASGRQATGLKVEESAKVESVAWSTLHAKLGAKVPILGATTVDAVDAWQKAGRISQAVIDFDVSGDHNRALAASILAGLLGRFAYQSEMKEALALAVSRINAFVDWDDSGAIVDDYLVRSHGDDVDAITGFRQLSFAHLKSEVTPLLVNDIDRSLDERQAVADLLGRLEFDEYGEFGVTPSPVVSFALQRGIRAVTTLSMEEMTDSLGRDQARAPIFHSVRTMSAPESRTTMAHEYLTGLAEGADTHLPEYRILDSLAREKSHYDTITDGQIRMDCDGNFVLTQTILDKGKKNEPHTRLSIIVPTADLARQNLDHLKAFTELIVDADTQQGPIWLMLDGRVHVMPFAEATSQGFTHGYSGSGPTDLSRTIRLFLEWVTGSAMTKAGQERLSGFIMGADMGQQLRISRSQVIRPGAFEAIE